MTDLRYITRCDYEHSRGYWVRYKQRTPHSAQKFFSDAKFGGKGRALKAATEFRDQLVQQRPDDVYGQTPNEGTLKLRWRTQGPWQYLTWTAEIQIAPGQRLKRFWSVLKHGEAAGKRMAKAWLEAQQAIQKSAYAAQQAGAAAVRGKKRRATGATKKTTGANNKAGRITKKASNKKR
jgi:hypothetical protein